MKTFLFIGISFFLLVIGCSKKIEPVQVGDMNEYKDPAYGFKIKYPKDWKNLGQAGKAVLTKSQEVIDKFMDPRSGSEGALVTVEVIRYSGRTAEEIIQTTKDELKQMNANLSPDAQGTAIAGKPMTQIPYRLQATTKTSIFGHIDFVAGDTVMYKLDFEGYGDQYAAHVPVFEAMIKSFEIPVVVAKKSDQWVPSGNMETYKSDFFTMQYPDNLEFVQTKKGANDLAMGMRADRLDCSINIDVFDAKKLPVEKVWEQNKGKYKVKSSGQTKIDDQNTFYADYSPMRDINSRVYFTVKNDKVVRATINYFAPQKDMYFPTFENMVKSIKLK